MLLTRPLGENISVQEVATELKIRGYYPLTAAPSLSPSLSPPLYLITTPLSPPVSPPVDIVKILPSVSPVVIPYPDPIVPLSPILFEPIWEPVSPVLPVTPFLPLPDPPPFVIDEFPILEPVSPVPEPFVFEPIDFWEPIDIITPGPVSPAIPPLSPVVVDVAAEAKGVWMVIAALGAILLFGKDKRARRVPKKRKKPTERSWGTRRRELTA